ncbi:PDZ domain-containing protein [Clostridium tepidum]|uniref:PDZ domain-containing protein n=1 Tax=Clostridium tepidum TaxID=1962263 RepID=A0A1S9IGK5_9CLOT|nr:PDZ domain-containing protein [Clostridium tepidum]MCR1934422.1 PDZ domain-containing protein [Clostridium tepidum]MDU6878031.1 PDZ domain-containing protein [Clostridium botulinum]OOO62343.1 PDZ domain-containing protein [Clostridium tepidum]OOO69363.1 PDZ domain-containing protein [Clostridium tepidum]
MDILLITLKSVAYLLTDPFSVVVLLLLSLILYRKNRKTIIMQKMIIGQRVSTAFELTISEVVLGIFAGVVASLIMAYLGIFFNEDSAIYLIFLMSMFFMLFNPRFICFSYSGAALGIMNLIFINMAKLLDMPQLNFIKIDIPALMSMVAILHLVEGILVMIDGDRGYVPVFTNRDDKIIGGFVLQRYWILPIAFMLMLNNQSISNISQGGAPMPNWWPLLKSNIPSNALKLAVMSMTCFYGVIGYNSVTFTKTRKEKKFISGSYIIIYSLLLFILSRLALMNTLLKVVVLIFAPVGHEAMIYIQKYFELRGKPRYVSTEEGIMVLDVAKNSIANKMGIKSGDLLLQVNDREIDSEEDIVKSIEDMYGHISFKIRNDVGRLKTVKYPMLNSYEKLGIVFVPKNVPKNTSVIKVKSEKFQDILEKIKNKDKDE